MSWNEPGNKNNDPWGGGGGNRGDQGPPDLDEVIRKVTNRLNRLFGGKGNGGDSDGSGRGGGGVPAGLLSGLVLLAVVVWAAMGFYTVDEAERGVVMRFGELQEGVIMPGLRWNPPVIDSVQKVNVSQVNTSSYSNDMLTADENIVHVEISVQYLIQDPVRYVIQVQDPRGGLDQAVESAIRHVVGSTTMDLVLTQGRADVAAEVQERSQRYMDHYGTGIMVTQVNVQDAQPPNAVQGAFDDVIRAREDEQRAQNQALSYANRVVPEARGEAQRIIEEANAYQDRVVNLAQGEADRFDMLYTEYQASPEVMRERLYIDAMQDVLSNSSKVLIDVENGNNMMFLPLDRIMSQGMQGNDDIDTSRLTERQLQQLMDQSSSQGSSNSGRNSTSQSGRGGR
ncbi:MAG: FtsH protease activity modulator HflK [Pseudohongiellaceae bacterium]